MSQLGKNLVGKALALVAVLLFMTAGQAHAAEDKKDDSVKGRLEILEQLVRELQDDRDSLKDEVDGLKGELIRVRTEYNDHKASASAHHTKTTSFGDLNDTAGDAQIPNDITVDYAGTCGNADTVDGMHASALDQSAGLASLQSTYGTHAADAAAHHAAITSFAQLSGAASDAQIPNDITVDYAGTCGNADTVDNKHADELGGDDDLVDRVEDLEDLLLPHFSRTGNDIYIEGANLHVVNGRGLTQTKNGFGNIIIGYNETRGGGADNRTGSHMLVIGSRNNYSEYGGIVAGDTCTTSGRWSSVTGGLSNTASGWGASVAGGFLNTASGDFCSSVSGGRDNVASGTSASVSGGNSNVAGGSSNSVSGGARNSTSDYAAWIGGGSGNRASNSYASVSGGRDNVASGNCASVSGGFENVASGFATQVSGGRDNVASGGQASVSGGEDNVASGGSASVSGGLRNDARGNLSSVSGGRDNVASGVISSVSGGDGVTESGNHGYWRAGDVTANPN